MKRASLLRAFADLPAIPIDVIRIYHDADTFNKLVENGLNTFKIGNGYHISWENYRLAAARAGQVQVKGDEVTDSVPLVPYSAVPVQPTIPAWRMNEYWTIDQAAEFAACSRDFIERAIGTGKLRAYPRGRAKRLRRLEVEQWAKGL